MGKVILSTLELSDIKKVMEDVLENKLKGFTTQEKKELNFLSRKDTAKLLCISLPTLHEWTKTGVITAHRIGNRVLFKENEITQALSKIQTSNSKRYLSC